MKIAFEYVYESLIDKETFTDSGELIIDGNKYHLLINESEIFCDGETLWNHVVSAGEVYVSNPENAGATDEFFLNNPENLFSFYDDDFKYRLTGEISYMDEEYYQVDLFPKDLNKTYHTINMLINKKDYRLYSLGMRGKQGVNHTIIILKYNPNYKVRKDEFIFDSTRYPEVEIIDTRL